MWVADSMETLPWGTKVAFCGIAKLCFVGIQKYMLNECVYFHQWHTRAARSAQGYQFINFYSGLRCPLNSNLSCRWSGISCFHLLKFKHLVIKRFALTRFDPTCQVCMWVRCWFSSAPLSHTPFVCMNLRDMSVLTVSYLLHISWNFLESFYLFLG